MDKTGGNFFERYIEKIVLAVVGIVCAWLLITHVLFSPNKIEYDNRKFAAGRIDDYIANQALELDNVVNARPKLREVYEPNVSNFLALIDTTLADIDANLYLPVPYYSSMTLEENRIYQMPLIGKVDGIAAEHIRAVAYVPLEQIDEENAYQSSNSESNDLDFVTVEGRFDVVGLYERFKESFTGLYLDPQWRDPCLGEVVFAAVQLQRQQLEDDGNWSGWQVVPRAKIEQYRELFEVIEDVKNLSAGGIKVRMLQFDNSQVRGELLQPAGDQIASAHERWFPPSIHKKYVKYMKETQLDAMRSERESENLEKEKLELELRRIRIEASRRKTSSSGTSTTIGDSPGMTTIGDSPGTVSRRESALSSRRERGVEEELLKPETVSVSETVSESDFSDEFDSLSIVQISDIRRMDGDFVFWANDDTVQVGQTYRYRIKLGVFNPIAGTNWFSKDDKALKNKVVLWSDFSDVSDVVEIPKMLYFFPVAITTGSGRLQTQVARYKMGYWYIKGFFVLPGEVIGCPSVIGKKEDGLGLDSDSSLDSVDFSTGMLFLDFRAVNDWSFWSGKSRKSAYFEMLYSVSGDNIEHLAVKQARWPGELNLRYRIIRKLERQPHSPLRQWGSEDIRRPYRPTTPGRRPGPIGDKPFILGDDPFAN